MSCICPLLAALLASLRRCQADPFTRFPGLSRPAASSARALSTSLPRLCRGGRGHLADTSPSGLLRRTFVQDYANLRLGLDMVDPQALEAAVDAIGRARQILVFGGGVAMGPVSFLGSSLQTMGFPAEYSTADGLPLVQQLASLTHADLAVGIGFYRYVDQTVKLLERARELGIPRVALTDSPLSPLVRLADHALLDPRLRGR